VSERCEVVGGDFFEAVPRGGDAYLLRQVLHDFADPPASRILRNCRAAMGPTSRLLVVERVITGDLRACLAELEADVEMLVAQGGLERSESEYRALFAQAGFRLAAVVPVERSHFAVFEAAPSAKKGEKRCVPGMTSFLNQTRPGTATTGRVIPLSGRCAAAHARR
jgi:hypothetical protein